MDELELYFRFAAALAIGVLVGLEREYNYDPHQPRVGLPAGVRTFGLMGLAGCTGALLSDELNSPLPFVLLLLLLGMIMIVSYGLLVREGHVGFTTEVAGFVTVLAGALCYLDHLPLAAALGVTTTAMLSFKPEVRRVAEAISQADIRAVLRFAAITAIVLPLLPNQTYGPPPFDVFNPFKTWLIVVLISGVSLLGYLLLKFVGARRAIGLTGLLGGLASSTAVTLSFAERSQESPDLSRPLALGLIIAWTVMFGRAVIEVAVLNTELAKRIWLPLLAVAVVGIAAAGYYYFSERGDEGKSISFNNPFELSAAIKFGLLYVAVLFLAKAGEVYLGNLGIYLSSIVSGIAGIDPIALSMAELSGPGGTVDLSTAARAVVLAAMSNTVAKGGIVMITGSPALRRALLPGFILILVAGTGAAIFLT